MSKNVFTLNSEECELLLAFETSPSLEKLSQVLAKDISNISRALNKMHLKLPVIEKQSGRWVLTEQGRLLNQHTRDSIQYQKTLLNQQSFLRIGSNREFAARIIGPHFLSLQKLFPDTQLRICAYEDGVEKPLLDGLADIGIDCERPFSPDISYKIAIKEEIVAVSSPTFKSKYIKSIRNNELHTLPHLLCDRLFPDRILKKSENYLNIIATFNDIATTREVCRQSLGWALLPKYAIEKELQEKQLVILETSDLGLSNYGVWWPRHRKNLESYSLKLKDWLTKI